MTEREEIIEQIALLSSYKTDLATKALAVEKLDRDLADWLDELWDAVSDGIGRLQRQLHEIESTRSRRVFLADAAYGRST